MYLYILQINFSYNMYYIKFKRSIHFSLRGGNIHYYSHPHAILPGKNINIIVLVSSQILSKSDLWWLRLIFTRNSFQGTQKQQLGEKHHFSTPSALLSYTPFEQTPLRNRYHFRRFFRRCRGRACRLGAFWVCGEQVSWILVIHKYTPKGNDHMGPTQREK